MQLSTILATASAVSALMIAPDTVQGYTNPITIKGYKMFDAKTGAYFAAKGIDYYPRPNAGEFDANNIDFFTDDHYDIWSKDLPHLAATGANAVRLYAVDPSKSHDNVMTSSTAALTTSTMTLASATSTPKVSQTTGSSASPPITTGFAMSAIAACMALAMGVAFA